MKRILVLIVVAVMTQLAISQTQIKGVVVDNATGETLIGVTVLNTATGAAVTSSLDGSFSIKITAAKQQLKFTYVGYTAKTVEASSSQPKLGNIALESEAIGLKDVVVTSSVAIRRKTPVALSVIDPIIIEEKLGTKEFPEILKSTPGVYATKQGGGFGDSRINLRGFESANIAVMINGVPVNDMEWGGVYWSNWAGLSDVTRSMQVQRGLGASKVAAPSLGGSINIVTKSTDAQKGGAASYGVGNDGYEKISFAASTGLTPNNWAITLLGAKTTGNGYIQGTEFESYSYFINISKKINDNHQLSFTAFGAPQWHNQRNNNDRLTTEEWKKNPLKYKYNPTYGFDMNGQRKVSSYNYYHKPQISLNHFWTINEKSSLSTALYVSIGNGGGYSGQGYSSTDRNNWFGVPSGTGKATEYDPNNETFRNQDGTFNYAHIYSINKPSADNTSGSKMVMSNSINKHRWYGLLSTYNTKIGQNIDFYGGIDIRYYKGIHTNQITDLYGGKFFIDLTPRPNVSNTDWTTKKLYTGDIVYRDYDGFVFSQGIFGQAEYNKNNLSTFISLSASNTSSWRYDRFYYDAANAKSQTKSYLGYSVKGGANYNINDHHNVFANIGVISRAPFFSGGVFLQSTTSNTLNPNGINERAFSAEIGYGYKSKYLSGNVNVYRTKWIDKTMVITSTQNQEIQYANLEGLNALHQGVEFDFVSKPTKDLEFKGMVSLGDWTWDSNATGYLYTQQGQPSDTKGLPTELLGPNHAKIDINLKGIHVANSAQTTAALGFNYQLVKGFKVGLDGNYFGRNYASFKINSAIGVNDFAQPWRIPDAYTVDFNASYRFQIGEYEASLIGNIDNLLDEEYVADAFDGTTHTEKDAQVFYGFGRTWSVTLKFKF